LLLALIFAGLPLVRARTSVTLDFIDAALGDAAAAAAPS
jgi:hypothetical protein